jgi:hypothetical protein
MFRVIMRNPALRSGKGGIETWRISRCGLILSRGEDASGKREVSPRARA